MDSSNKLISAIEQLHSEHIVKLLSIKLKLYQKNDYMLSNAKNTLNNVPNILHYYDDDV